MKLVLKVLSASLMPLVTLYGVGRCCASPLFFISAVLSGCFFVGCAFCEFSHKHAFFDLLVAITAVSVHHASTDVIRRARAWLRKHAE